MFFTLVAGLAVGAGYFIYFLRSRHNREIAATALQGDGRSRGVAPSGAGAGLLAIALIAMALLAAGYTTRRDTKPTPPGSAATNNSLNTSRANPNATKPYQPNNPDPDIRAAPTGSSTGAGPDSGGRPEQQPKQWRDDLDLSGWVTLDESKPMDDRKSEETIMIAALAGTIAYVLTATLKAIITSLWRVHGNPISGYSLSAARWRVDDHTAMTSALLPDSCVRTSRGSRWE
jgi:hypothetical protein